MKSDGDEHGYLPSDGNAAASKIMRPFEPSQNIIPKRAIVRFDDTVVVGPVYHGLGIMPVKKMHRSPYRLDTPKLGTSQALMYFRTIF